MPAHNEYMQRAIALAEQASGAVTPNPLVGCVVVKDDHIVGEGFHQGAGMPHAEVNALAVAGINAEGATMYVTLEPCSHTGKTPPCTDAIIKAGISTVVYAVSDPNPEASGGAALLRTHGIETIKGIEEKAATYLARFFLHHTKTSKPYVVAKYASSLDGRIASHTGDSQWITGEQARNRAHELRQAVDAILVGAQTAINDDPALTTRLPNTDNTHHPIRIVLDSSGRVPLTSQVFQTAKEIPTHVITTDQMEEDHAKQLVALGAKVTEVECDASTIRVSIPAVLSVLGAQGIQSLMVEGGQSVFGSLMDAESINETWAFFAPKIIGGDLSPGPIGGMGIELMKDAATLTNVVHEQLGDDWLIRGEMQYKRGIV